MADRRLHFAIVGCGRIAKRHAFEMQAYGDLQAVCDFIPEKANSFAREYNCHAYSSLNDLLTKENFNVLVVCTPNGLHAEHSICGLNAGVHVLCEKPMAIISDDCRKMIEAAEGNQKKLFIVKQNRFNPPVMTVKEMLSKGMLGKIFSIQLNCFWNRNTDYYKNSWKGSLQLDGGTLFTQFSHFIDLLYWLFGDIKKIEGITANLAHKKIIEFEDTGMMTIEFKNGIIGGMNYTVNAFQKNMEGSLTIFAEKGTVKIGGQYLNRLEYQCIKDYRIAELPEGNNVNEYGTYSGSMSNHDMVYKNVADVLFNNGSMYADAYDGLKTVEIIEKFYWKARRIN